MNISGAGAYTTPLFSPLYFSAYFLYPCDDGPACPTIAPLAWSALANEAKTRRHRLHHSAWLLGECFDLCTRPSFRSLVLRKVVLPGRVSQSAAKVRGQPPTYIVLMLGDPRAPGRQVKGRMAGMRAPFPFLLLLLLLFPLALGSPFPFPGRPAVPNV